MDYAKLISEAQALGEKAGDEWMDKMTKRGPAYSVHSEDIVTGEKGPAIGYLLDLCGNAHVKVLDRRTKFAKWLIAQDPQSQRYTVTVPKPSKYRGRQEYGLHQAIAEAMIAHLRAAGIKKLTVWEYID